MDVLVDIAAALICFSSTCYPVLVGKDTPTGQFQFTNYSTKEPGYGGNILLFKRENNMLFAVHRVLDLPGQQRPARLKSPNPAHRMTVTAGCVNVEPEVFDMLVDCCSNSKVTIK
jgi:hypothetical protein